MQTAAKTLKNASWQQYKEEKAVVYKQRLSPLDRQASLTVLIFERLQREERIRDQVQEKILYFGQKQKEQPKENTMGLAAAFGDQSKKNRVEKDALVSTHASVSVKENMARLQREEEVLVRLADRLKLNDIIALKEKNGSVEYKEKATGKSVFRDTGSGLIFSNLQQSKENIAIGLELAAAKYGQVLKLTGSAEFKEKAIQVAAERGLAVTFASQTHCVAFEREKIRLAQEKPAKQEITQKKGLSL